MKKIFLVCFVCLVLVGCNTPTMDAITDPLIGKDAFDHVRDPQNKFSSFDEAWEWTANNISYNDSGDYEWQSLRQTEDKRSGMCVDYCSYLMFYADKFGHKVKMRGVRSLSGGYHAFLVIDGVEIEPQEYLASPNPYDYKIEDLTMKQVYEAIYYEYGNRNVSNIEYK